MLFILDESGSMGGRPWKQLCEAFQQYIDRRLQENAQSEDVVSIVQFSNHARMVCSCVPIREAKMGAYNSGGTRFLPAVQLGEQCLVAAKAAVDWPLPGRGRAPSRKTAVIMMTDRGSDELFSVSEGNVLAAARG